MNDNDDQEHVDCGAAKYDIDFYNVEMLVAWVATLCGVLHLTSNAQHHRLLALGRKPSAQIGTVGAVQVVDEPPIFVPQGKHSALIDALRALDVVVCKPMYKPFDYKRDENDPDDCDGDKRMAPVALAISTAYATGPVLHAALVRAGVRSVRTQRYNGKTPIDQWIASFSGHMVTGPLTHSALDVSGVVKIGDGKRIPLIKVLDGRCWKTMELCGEQGLGAGSLFLGAVDVGGGVRIDSFVGYPGRLVHELKARGHKGELQACGTVRTAAAYRRRTVAFLTTWCDEVLRADFADLGYLRFEARVVINHALFRGDWRALLDRVGVDSLAAIERIYAARAIKLACVLLTKQAYVDALRQSIARLCEPKYRVGFTLGSEDERSINAVKCRFADINAQAGLHPGLRISNVVNRAAVQLKLDPSYQEVDADGSIFDDDYLFVEPALPPPPPRAVAAPARRAHVLVIGDTFSLRAARAYIAQVEAKQKLEQFGYPDVPDVPHVAYDSLRRTIVPPRPMTKLVALFGDASQAEFRAAHPEMSPINALRLQILATVKIAQRGPKFIVKRAGRQVKGCSAHSVEQLLDYLVTNHQQDWQAFDKIKSN